MLWDGMRREGIGTDDLQFGSRGRMAYLEKAELRRDQLMSVSFFFPLILSIQLHVFQQESKS